MSQRIGLLMAIAALALVLAGCTGSSADRVPTVPDQPAAVTSEQSAPQVVPDDPAEPERTSQIAWLATAEIEPNDIPGDGQIVPNFAMVDGSIDAASDQNDYYLVEMLGPGCIYVKLGWYDPDAWVNLYLYDSGIVPVQYDNADTSSPKQVYVWDLPTGIYYVRVKAQEGSSDYRIKFAFSYNWHEPLNDSIETTAGHSIIAYGSDYVSCSHPTNDPNDYYEITINSKQTDGMLSVTLDWAGPNNPDFNLYIYDVDYNPLAVSNGLAQPETCSIKFPPEGNLYVRVKANGNMAVYDLLAKVYPVLIIDPGPFYDFEPQPIPWPPPDPPWLIFHDFDPWAAGGGISFPGQWVMFNPQPEPPAMDLPQLPGFGF
jgi:hypothetical protein